MNRTFSAALGQVDHLTTLMGVPASVRATIRHLILSNSSPDTITHRARVMGDEPTLAQIARRFHQSSLSRNVLIGADVARDGPWNMLLDLFAANEEGRSVSVSSLCLASGLPPSTALRAVHWMTGTGIIERDADIDDNRRSWLRLSPTTHEKMAATIASFTVPTPTTVLIR